MAGGSGGGRGGTVFEIVHGSGAITNGTLVIAPSLTTQTSGDLIVGAALAGESSWGQGVIVQPPATVTTSWSATDSSAD